MEGNRPTRVNLSAMIGADLDRIEAYDILTRQMNLVAEQSFACDSGKQENRVELEILGSNGSSYHLVLVLEQVTEKKLRVSGRIYDNNSQRLSMLEEKVDFLTPHQDL